MYIYIYTRALTLSEYRLKYVFFFDILVVGRRANVVTIITLRFIFKKKSPRSRISITVLAYILVYNIPAYLCTVHAHERFSNSST